MSSPCKRIKLTPKRELDRYLRHTQESKITSTPQRSTEKTVSPDVSRISSTAKSVRTRLSDVFSTNNQENVSSNSNNEETSEPRSTPINDYESISEKTVATSKDLSQAYDAYLDDLGKIKYTGNIWKFYKPLHDRSLYARVSQEPQNTQEVVTELLLLYNRKPEVAICSLLKFCVDVCGYQNFNIADHYNFGANAVSDIIKMMETDGVLEQQGTLKKTGRYLLMEPRVQLAIILKLSIYNFLHKLIFCIHERGILYDQFFSKHFFLFVKAMSFSDIRAIRHTGVIFAVKLLTALVIVYSKIINDPNCSSDGILGMNSSPENALLEQKRDINMLLEFFYFIFIKNCRLQDNKVTLMRVECIHELGIWIKYFPKIFITQLQAVSYLCKLITDMSKEVRYAALETFEALVTTPRVLTILRNFMPDFAEAVGKRFYDVDNKVAIKAIDIFTIFLKQDESLVTTHRFKLLTGLVFDTSFPIGEAAARFVTYYLETSEDNEHMILIQLAKFSKRPGYATRQLVVEGCLHNCSSLQNWDNYLDILLLYGYIEMDVKQAIAEMFSESVYQTLKGCSSITRDMSPKVTNVDPAEHKKVAKCFPKLNTLLKNYKNHPNMLIQFLNIFCLVSKDILDENYCQYYMDICDTMEILFYQHDEANLLKKLAETFHHFCDIRHFAKRAKSVTERICSNCAGDVQAYFQNGEQPKTVLKVAVLFSHFNLTKHFTWEALFECWSETDQTTTANLLSCCQWYLVWSLRNLTDTDYPLSTELLKEFPLVSRNCKEYISSCFNILQNVRGLSLHFRAYESLCDLHLTYMKDLEGPMKLLKQLEELKLTISDKQLQSLLVSFLDKYVISNTAMALHDRRTYVVKYVDLIHNNVLPPECLGYIFKYYHAYNKEFGPIIESSLTSMSVAPDENIFLMVVIYTITIVYENILNKHGVMDLRTEEVRDIKLLLKQFLTFKVFRTSKNSFKKLLYLAFKYSFKDESKYSFLYFAKYFIDLLTDEDKKEIFELFKSKIPPGVEKNDAVLYIANYMKTSKSSITPQKTPSKKIAKEDKAPTNKKNVSKRRPKPSNKSTETKRKRNIKTPQKRKYVNNEKTQRTVDTHTETDISEDDMTIHDSESDDLEESISQLRI